MLLPDESLPQPIQRSNTLSVAAPQPIQPIQPIYYAVPQPVNIANPSGTHLPLSSSPLGTHLPLSSSPPGTPPPQTQFVQLLHPGSSPALSPQYVFVNGQTMLLQPLQVQPQPVAHFIPSPTGTPQLTSSTPIAQNQPQTQYVVLQPPSTPPPPPMSISQGPPQPSAETIPPPVPSKPSSIRIQPAAAHQVYVPTPINNSIAVQLNAAPVSPISPEHDPGLPQPETSTNVDMPGAFPVTNHSARQNSLPTHIHQTQQQTRRLSWDTTTHSPPPMSQGRRGRTTSDLNSHIPPLTPLGTGPYPPLGHSRSITSPREGREGRGDYFPSLQTADGRPEASIQRPQPVHSRRGGGNELLRRSSHSNNVYPLDDYPASPGRLDPLTHAGDLVPVTGGTRNRDSGAPSTATLAPVGGGIRHGADDGQRPGGLLAWLGIGGGGRPPPPPRRSTALLERLNEPVRLFYRSFCYVLSC
jgi:hypothetical protein